MKKVLLPVVAMFLLAACTPAATPDPTPATDTSTTKMQQEQTMENTDGAMIEAENSQSQTIAVKADDFTYDVKEIKVKKGDVLKLAVTNTEGMHDLKIDELNVNTDIIPAGQMVEVAVPTDKPGTYEYYCSVGKHREMGMKGTLIIE